MLWCDKMHLQKVAEMQHALPKTSRRLRFNNVHKFVICSSPILLWTKLLQLHYIIQIGIIAVYFPHSIWWLNLTWGSTKRQIKNTNYFLNRYDFVISSLVYSKLINQFILKKKEEEARQKRGKERESAYLPTFFPAPTNDGTELGWSWKSRTQLDHPCGSQESNPPPCFLGPQQQEARERSYNLYLVSDSHVGGDHPNLFVVLGQVIIHELELIGQKAQLGKQTIHQNHKPPPPIHFANTSGDSRP